MNDFKIRPRRESIEEDKGKYVPIKLSLETRGEKEHDLSNGCFPNILVQSLILKLTKTKLLRLIITVLNEKRVWVGSHSLKLIEEYG